MRVLASIRDSRLKAAASVSCVLLGILVLSRALLTGQSDVFDLINIMVLLSLGAAFAVGSAWLDKKPVLETNNDYLVVRRGIFSKSYKRAIVQEVTSRDKSVCIRLVSDRRLIEIKSLSIPAAECATMLRQWLNDPTK